MIKSEIINKIVDIPKELRSKNNLSFHTVLKDTGYFSLSNGIDENGIKTILLKKNNDIIDYWLSYSEDKRVSSGWYFLQKENEGYEVGNINNNGKKEHLHYFNNAVEACAYFIKKEIENIKLSF